MNNLSKMKVFLLSIFLGLTTIASAQIRSIDIEADNESPSGYYVDGDTIYLKASIKNNGPDNLVVGDTLFYAPYVSTTVPPTQFTSGYRPTRMVILKEPINVGSTIKVIDEIHPALFVTYPDAKDSFGRAIFCIKFFDQWSIDGIPVSLTYKDPNLSNNEDCDTIRVYGSGSIPPTSINNNLNKRDYKPFLFPNPTSDIVTTDLSRFSDKNIRIEIIDLQGRLILQRVLSNQYKSKETLDISKIVPGIYIVQMHTSTGIVYDKLLKI